MTTTTTARPASEKQQAFITRLLAEKDLAGTAYEGWTPDWSRATTASARCVIDFLLTLPKSAEAPAVERAEVPEGMHRSGGTIFKVQRAIHGSGNLYAKRLTANERCYCSDLQGVLCGVCRDPKSVTWTFEYAAGVMKFLSTETAMTLEEAKEFGAVYGTCCACGRTLTDEGSIEAGIGPVCAKKF